MFNNLKFLRKNLDALKRNFKLFDTADFMLPPPGNYFTKKEEDGEDLERNF